MAYEPGPLEAALAAAVGNDPALVEELRLAFLDSAERHAETLRLAQSDPEWQYAALKLKGLAASFGASDLIEAAERAAVSARGDAVALRAIGRALDAFRD